MKCPEGLILSISAAAIAISKELTKNEIEILGAAATQFGDTLTTLAVLKDDSVS